MTSHEQQHDTRLATTPDRPAHRVSQSHERLTCVSRMGLCLEGGVRGGLVERHLSTDGEGSCEALLVELGIERVSCPSVKSAAWASVREVT